MVTALKEKTKKVVHFLTMELPTYVGLMAPNTRRETTDAFSVRTTRVENAPQIAHHNRENDTEPGRATGAISNHTKDPTTYVIMKSDRPVFTPMSSDWFYLGSRDAPLVRQGEPIKRPAEIYIAPFNDKIFPAGNITNQSEDHNWRRRKKT